MPNFPQKRGYKCRNNDSKCLIYSFPFITGASSLHLAIAYHNNELVTILIKCGANIHQRAIGKWTTNFCIKITFIYTPYILLFILVAHFYFLLTSIHNNSYSLLSMQTILFLYPDFLLTFICTTYIDFLNFLEN